MSVSGITHVVASFPFVANSVPLLGCPAFIGPSSGGGTLVFPSPGCVTNASITPRIPSWWSVVGEERRRGVDKERTEAWDSGSCGGAWGDSVHVNWAMAQPGADIWGRQGTSHERCCWQGTFIKKCQKRGVGTQDRAHGEGRGRGAGRLGPLQRVLRAPGGPGAPRGAGTSPDESPTKISGKHSWSVLHFSENTGARKPYHPSWVSHARKTHTSWPSPALKRQHVRMGPTLTSSAPGHPPQLPIKLSPVSMAPSWWFQ